MAESWTLVCIVAVGGAEEHRKADDEVPLVCSVDERFYMFKWYLLVDDDSIFILNREVRLNEDEKFSINHHVANTHLFLYSLVTED